MLSIVIAFLKACIQILSLTTKVIERWSHRNRKDHATQTDVSIPPTEVNVPTAYPVPTAPPPPEGRPTNPTPTATGKATATATAKATAKLAGHNKPCWLPPCPECKATMVFRKAHHGGHFWAVLTFRGVEEPGHVKSLRMLIWDRKMNNDYKGCPLQTTEARLLVGGM